MTSQKTPSDRPSATDGKAPRSLEEARRAIDGMMEAARQAVDANYAKAAGVQVEASDASVRVMAYAHSQVRSALEFAEKLAHATSVAELARLQIEFARSQAEALGTQAQEMSAASARLAAKLAKKPSDPTA